MNRAKEAGRARLFIGISLSLFVLAALSTLLHDFGFYLTLVLILFAGFFMLFSRMAREREVPQKLPVKKELLLEELVDEA